MKQRIRRKAKRAIVKSLEQGATVSQACAAAGVSRRVFYEWLHKDPDFAGAVELAYTKQIALAETALFRAIEAGDLKAAMWFLERRAPEYRPPSMQQQLAESEPLIELVEVEPAHELDFCEVLAQASRT
ncbi:MAG: helix-turn-helix domain-containing protein [Fimbriimonadales bacterium]|nr:MAG: hypothetical protein KatS3mg018_0160 [Fimbriimonadales bacterium]